MTEPKTGKRLKEERQSKKYLQQKTTKANQFQLWEPEHGSMTVRTWILYHQSQSQSPKIAANTMKSDKSKIMCDTGLPNW